MTDGRFVAIQLWLIAGHSMINYGRPYPGVGCLLIAAVLWVWSTK